MEKYFVIARVDVQEHDQKKELNTPGGEALMKTLGGTGGLPFFAFQNSDGSVIVTSNAPKGGNIGHPSAPEEVDWFMEMLQKAVPQMTSQERGTLENWLRHQKK